MQWNARSHAANQGYSHSSGMEITSASEKCLQVVLRRPGPRASDGRGRRPGRPRATLHVVPVELLAPQQPGVGAARHVPILVRHLRVDHGAVELVGLVLAVARALRRSPAPKVSGDGARCDSRSRTVTSAPAGTEANRYQNADLGAVARRVDRRRVAVHHPPVDAVLGVAATRSPRRRTARPRRSRCRRTAPRGAPSAAR